MSESTDFMKRVLAKRVQEHQHNTDTVLEMLTNRQEFGNSLFCKILAKNISDSKSPQRPQASL